MNVNPASRTIAYFDTNIFDNILKKTGGVVENDETRLRAAIGSGKLSLVNECAEHFGNAGRPAA